MRTQSKPTRVFVGLAIALATCAVVAGQPVPRDRPPAASSAAEPADEETEETAREMEATPAERRAELRALMRTADRLAEQRIDELQRDFERRRSQLSTRTRERTRVALEGARRERAQFREEMKRLDTNSTAAWIDLRAGAVAAYRDLAYAVRTAVVEFGNGDSDRSGDAARTDDQEEPDR